MMKKFFSYTFMLLLAMGVSSFRLDGDSGIYKNDGYFFAALDNKAFELRDNDKYHAELLNKTGATIGVNTGRNRVATSLTFYGHTLNEENNNTFDERLEIEYSFNEGALGEAGDMKIELHYNHYNYYQLPDASTFKITKVEWSKDRKSFLLTAEFDCQMRQWGYPAESQPVIHMKGNIDNIQVTVPAWIAVKNTSHVAERL